MRKTVYIAGPITGGDLCDNINRATAAAVALIKAGFAPLCPHWSVYAKPAQKRSDFAWCNECLNPPCSNCQRFSIVTCVATPGGNDEVQYDEWITVCLPWVAVADAVLRLPGPSIGADLEVACAREHNVPVFDSVESLITANVPPVITL